jgi:hypothetical protein
MKKNVKMIAVAAVIRPIAKKIGIIIPISLFNILYTKKYNITIRYDF